MKARAALGWVYLTALFTFVFAPIGASVVFSFNSDRFPTLPLGHFTTDWYARAFSRPEVWEAIGNSLIVAGVTSVIATFIGFATAYTDFRYGFRFKQESITSSTRRTVATAATASPMVAASVQRMTPHATGSITDRPAPCEAMIRRSSSAVG